MSGLNFQAALSAVIARLDPAIQYQGRLCVSREAATYWMPACAGMTTEEDVKQRSRG
jgi:hypothetical protein